MGDGTRGANPAHHYPLPRGHPFPPEIEPMPDRDGVNRAQRALGITFRNPRLLEQALVHRSYLNEKSDFPLGSNERLEYLGDAVVELIVSDYLYARFPDATEGTLSTMRATLVRAQTLAQAARQLDLIKLLRLSRGGSRVTGRALRRLLAQAYEAVVGAIYLDQGLETTRDFVLRGLGPDLEQVETERLQMDPKSRLQELTQATEGLAPTYDLLDEREPGKGPRFAVQVRLGDQILGRGEGESKQDAEEAAARVGLHAYQSAHRSSTA